MTKADEDIMIFAFRYAITRHTYALYSVVEYILERKHQLSEFTIKQIINEAGAASQFYCIHECDQEVLDYLVLKLTD